MLKVLKVLKGLKETWLKIHEYLYTAPLDWEQNANNKKIYYCRFCEYDLIVMTNMWGYLEKAHGINSLP